MGSKSLTVHARKLKISVTAECHKLIILSARHEPGKNSPESLQSNEEVVTSCENIDKLLSGNDYSHVSG